MKIEASFVHLHGPLFFAGKNWGEKLDHNNNSHRNLTMVYDRDSEELEVVCGDKVTYIPSSNIRSYSPSKVTAPKAQEDPVFVVTPKGKRTAQVSSPMDHVHQGLGAGKVNDKQ